MIESLTYTRAKIYTDVNSVKEAEALLPIQFRQGRYTGYRTINNTLVCAYQFLDGRVIATFKLHLI